MLYVMFVKVKGTITNQREAKETTALDTATHGPGLTRLTRLTRLLSLIDWLTYNSLIDWLTVRHFLICCGIYYLCAPQHHSTTALLTYTLNLLPPPLSVPDSHDTFTRAWLVPTNNIIDNVATNNIMFPSVTLNRFNRYRYFIIVCLSVKRVTVNGRACSRQEIAIPRQCSEHYSGASTNTPAQSKPVQVPINHCYCHTLTWKPSQLLYPFPPHFSKTGVYRSIIEIFASEFCYQNDFITVVRLVWTM